MRRRIAFSWPARAAVFALALAIRLAAIRATGPSTVAFGDGFDYLQTAERLCREGAYPDRGSLPFFRAPLFPAFIAAVTGCDTHRVAAVKGALAAADAATCVLVGEIAAALFASGVAGLVAALIGCVDPLFVAGVCDVRTEPLFMLLLAAGFLGAIRATSTSSVWPALASGCAIGAAALARPAGLVAAAVTFAWFALGRAEPARLRRIAAFLVGLGMALAPWTARNALRFGELIVVNDASGINFWRGAHPEIERIEELNDPETYLREGLRFEQDTTERATREIESKARTPMERSRAWRAAAVDLVAADPARAARTAVRKALRYWRPWLSPREHGPTAVALSAVRTIWLFAVGGAGLALLWRTRRRDAGLILGLFFVAWIAHVPFQVVMRFRMPFTDPLLIACAAGALLEWTRAGRASPRRETVCNIS